MTKLELISFQKKLEKLVDINYHNEAVLELAKFLKNKSYITVLKNIISIHTTIGYMPPELIEFVRNITKELKQEFVIQYGDIKLAV